MWRGIKELLREKVDVKITGYISAAVFALTAAALICLIGLSASRSGELSVQAAFVGFGLIVCNLLAIRLARWGQTQTGRRLKLNRTAIRLNQVMIGVMLAIYLFGIVLL